MRSLFALLPLACLAAGPALAADTVTDKVFGLGPMNDVTAPTVLHYRYELNGATMQAPYDAPVTMDVREVSPNGEKKVFFDMFTGHERRQFGPAAAKEQNPLVFVFLQRDVAAMGNLTGGAPGYFQQRIREAFNGPAEVTPLPIEVDGRKLQATRVVIHPFHDDPMIGRFPKFKDKAYEFVVAPELPGGIYRLASTTPDPEGHAVIGESMTFERADRSTADAAGSQP